jgi:hypothetical protein
MIFSEVKLEIFAPAQAVDSIRQALHEAGAGRIGNYDHCVAISTVQGYWRPLDGADPFDGQVGAISEGTECRIEMNCKAELVQAAIQAVRLVHPYEEPLINVVPLLNHFYE